MKGRISGIIFAIVILGFCVGDVFGESELMFQKSDAGDGLTPQQCKERTDVIGSYFEPDIPVAKLIVENHPAFKKIVKDNPYTLISTGVRSSIYSDNCGDDLEFFELHYATNVTDDSYTRIYTSLDRISYDVAEIRINQIEGKEPEPFSSQPLMLNALDWKEIQVPGEYTNSDPPIPSQTFRFPYLVNNGKINEISGTVGEITVALESKEKAHAIFALKIPRSYPYTDHDDEDAGHPGHGLELFLISDSHEEYQPNITKLDCFYEVWFSFSGNQTVTIPFRWSYLQVDWSFHGDDDVPDYCKGYTQANTNYDSLQSPLKQFKDRVELYNVVCKNNYILVTNSQEPACMTKDTARILWERGWIDKSPDIYKTNSDEKIRTEFQSKLIGDAQAKRIVEEFIKEKHLKLNPERSQDELTVTTDLTYTLLPKGYLSLIDVNYETALPTFVLPPWWEGYYRTPSWYTELQKDYLGLENHRVDDGDLYWKVSYRSCLDCISDYPIFFVDPIQGKVKKTSHVESFFIPYYS